MPGLLRDTAQLRVSGGFSARHCQRARLQLPECSRQSTGGSCHLCRTQRGSARGATGTQTQTVHSRSRGAPPVTPAELGEGGATAGQETSGRAGLRPWPGLQRGCRTLRRPGCGWHCPAEQESGAPGGLTPISLCCYHDNAADGFMSFSMFYIVLMLSSEKSYM